MSILKDINESLRARNDLDNLRADPSLQRNIELIRQYVDGNIDEDELPEQLRNDLYDAWYGAMPYGTAKGRTSTPDEWFMGLDADDIIDGYVQYVKSGVRQTP